MMRRLLWILLTVILTGIASTASATPPCESEYNHNRMYEPVPDEAPSSEETGDLPGAPVIERVSGQPLIHACDAHGLFVVELGDSHADGDIYEWTVRDTDGLLVQRGRGPAPHALAFETVDDDAYIHVSPSRYGLEETVRPYRIGQTYRMEVRTVDESGHRSEATHAAFTFDETGGGTSYEGLAIICLVAMAVIFAALIWIGNTLIEA